MGRIHDALKKAQEERERKRIDDDDDDIDDDSSSEGISRAQPRILPQPIEDPVSTLRPAKKGLARVMGVGQGPAAHGRLAVTPVAEVEIVRGPTQNFGEKLLSYHAPSDPRAEQFRALRTNLNVIQPEPHVIAIASSVRGEGTSVTAANLAVSLAEDTSCRVLIVNGDIRGCGLPDLLGVDPQHRGLVEVLEGQYRPEDVIQDSGIPRVSYVGSGRSVDNPGALLSTHYLTEAVEYWRASFDRVLVVLPAVEEVNDAATISRHVDGVVMVVKLASTPRRVTDSAIEKLVSKGIRVLGCVLTNSELPTTKRR